MASYTLYRRPRRLTITVPDHLFNWIYQRSDTEGRSASNFAAYLLEQAMHLSSQQQKQQQQR